MKHFDYDFDTVTQKLVLKFGPNEGLSFEDEEVPSILGFKGIRDISNHVFIHFGYKSENKGNSLNRHVGDFPVDITCGSQILFVYIDITEHQNVGDVRAPVIKIIESERRLRNGSINTVTPIHHKSYTNLDYEPILSNISNISEHPGRIEKLNWKTNSFYWNRKSYSQSKSSKNYLIWRHTIAIKHLNQCRIFSDTTDKEAVVLEPLMQVLEELLCHWHANFSGPQQKRLVVNYWFREHQS